VAAAAAVQAEEEDEEKGEGKEEEEEDEDEDEEDEEEEEEEEEDDAEQDDDEQNSGVTLSTLSTATKVAGVTGTSTDNVFRYMPTQQDISIHVSIAKTIKKESGNLSPAAYNREWRRRLRQKYGVNIIAWSTAWSTS
jgi:outer membrane biosynthesis protein TonB